VFRAFGGLVVGLLPCELFGGHQTRHIMIIRRLVQRFSTCESRGSSDDLVGVGSNLQKIVNKVVMHDMISAASIWFEIWVIVDPGKKNRFFRKISDFPGNFTQKESIFHCKFPKKFDFFR